MSPVLTQYVSQPITLDEQTQKMKQHLLQDIRRSAYVYRVDCGGCNACEIEIFAAITPVFDAERFGIKVVNTGRHHSRFRRGARFAATEDSRCGLSRSHRGDYATVVATDPAITAYRH